MKRTDTIAGVRFGLFIAAIVGGLCLTCRPATAADEPVAKTPPSVERVARLVRVPLPITGEALAPIQRFASRAMDEARTKGGRAVLIFEFDVPSDQAEFARSSQFGAARDLAYFLSSQELNDATTVAYVPDSIQGHAVLVVLACDEVVMAPDAEIGDAGVNEQTITPDIYSAYKEIAGRRRSIPEAVAVGLVDKAKKVVEVETDISREYVFDEELEALGNQRTIRSTRTLFEAGQPGRLSGDEARQLDFVAFKAGDRRELARALELPPQAIEEDPSMGRPWKAFRVEFRGPVGATMVDRAQNMIEDAVNKNDANFLCLWIDSPGGSPTDSVQLANFLARDLDPSKVRTVAYINGEALADASIVAMACDQVVIERGAVLGGSGAAAFSPEEIANVRETIRSVIAPAKSRSWSLPAAMIDPELTVYRCRFAKPGATQHYVEYFSDAELAAQPPGDWKKEAEVTRPGKPFQVDAADAPQYWLADHVVDHFGGFLERYGLDDDPSLLEPSWADLLVDALAAPGVAWLLVIIGGVALYAELHMPGIGLGGFVAAICFALFFWSRFLGGTAGWLEVTLFMAGVSFLLLEIFVLPGFGIFGLGGGLLVIVSLILASQTFIFPQNDYQFARLQHSLLMLAGTIMAIFALATLINRWLPKAPGLGQMVLAPPIGEEAQGISHREKLIDYGDLLGQHGTTLTPLVPAGKARFGDRRVDVVSEGDFIPRGTEIVVAQVSGNRVIVRPVEES